VPGLRGREHAEICRPRGPGLGVVGARACFAFDRGAHAMTHEHDDGAKIALVVVGRSGLAKGYRTRKRYKQKGEEHISLTRHEDHRVDLMGLPEVRALEPVSRERTPAFCERRSE
jgi:hypothetical protein